MNTIIVPTDFSPTSINAMNYAADLALEIKGSVLLLNIYQIPIAVTDTPIALISIDELKDSSEKQLQELQSGLQRVTSGKIDIQIKSILGDTTEELENVCTELKPFAVVMGTTGHSTLERSLFGSTTLKVIKHLTWPVLTVPAGKEYGKGIKKVGLACDFREIAETMPVTAIKNFLQQFSSPELHILNVDHNDEQVTEDTPKETLLVHTAFDDLHPEFHVISEKDVEDAIHVFAENNNLDLIITIPKKHKRLEGLFKKSSTRTLVLDSHVPVMCVHE